MKIMQVNTRGHSCHKAWGAFGRRLQIETSFLGVLKLSKNFKRKLQKKNKLPGNHKHHALVERVKVTDNKKKKEGIRVSRKP